MQNNNTVFHNQPGWLLIRWLPNKYGVAPNPMSGPGSCMIPSNNIKQRSVGCYNEDDAVLFLQCVSGKGIGQNTFFPHVWLWTTSTSCLILFLLIVLSIHIFIFYLFSIYLFLASIIRNFSCYTSWKVKTLNHWYVILTCFFQVLYPILFYSSNIYTNLLHSTVSQWPVLCAALSSSHMWPVSEQEVCVSVETAGRATGQCAWMTRHRGEMPLHPYYPHPPGTIGRFLRNNGIISRILIQLYASRAGMHLYSACGSVQISRQQACHGGLWRTACTEIQPFPPKQQLCQAFFLAFLPTDGFICTNQTPYIQ